MVATPSQMVALGTRLPDFSLPDTVTGKSYHSSSLEGAKAIVIMFICNHCPYVIHINSELVALGNDYKNKGVKFIAISSNDATHYPDDGPEKMRETAKKLGYPFPYLYDESQDVARSFGAACTPDFYVYDKNLSLVYRGQLDGSRPGSSIPVTGKDLRSALDLILAEKTPSAEQKPSIGCNIKWKRS